MADQTPLEQKRAEAKRFHGVSYDNRIDRFTAAITISGQKKHLGSFLTAELAGGAYKRARAQHPIERPRPNSDSIRQRMVEFNGSADYFENKAIAGQIFTAPDGQRFRLEGTDRYKRRPWYVWSSRCRACGVLFQLRTSIDLDGVVSMTRNCPTHHGARDGQQWPDPEAWDTKPGVSYFSATPRKADAATERAHADHLENIWQQIKGDAELEKQFLHIENFIMGEFFAQHGRDYPNSNQYAKFAAWLDQPNDPFAELLKKKQGAQASRPVNARLEDVGALAESPASDNSDLA